MPSVKLSVVPSSVSVPPCATATVPPVIDDVSPNVSVPPLATAIHHGVVPLDRRIDFLTLAGGKTIEIPFEVMVVFSTNLNPAEILEDAYLRRIQTKIKIDAVSEAQFCEIFGRIADEQGLDYEPEVIQNLATFIQETVKEPLRPCYPRDILSQICWAAKYEGRAPILDAEAIAHAVESYFLAPA